MEDLMRFKIGLLLLLFTISASPLFAHHSMEFIDIESHTTARQGEILAYLHYDYFTDDKRNTGADHWEFTPGFAIGIFDRLMFDVHCHLARFGVDHVVLSEQLNYSDGLSPFIEAFAASLQFRITDWENPFNMAISVIGELPMRHAIDKLDSSAVFGTTLIFGYDFGLHNNITANFTYERDGGEDAIAWGLGIKFVMSGEDEHAPAFGIEFHGDFGGHIYIMPGFYLSLTQSTVFKIGLSVGMSQFNLIPSKDNDEAKEEDYRGHVSLMRRW